MIKSFKVKGNVHMAIVVDPLRSNFIIASFKGHSYIKCFILYHLIPEFRFYIIATLSQPIYYRKHPRPGGSRILPCSFQDHERSARSWAQPNTVPRL